MESRAISTGAASPAAPNFGASDAGGRTEGVAGPSRCKRCAAPLTSGHGFSIGGDARCLRCTLMRTSLLRRSLLTGLVVGTALTAINQGNIILGGHFPASLYWKIPLTYCVPFCVATWGALINSRS